MPEIHSQKDIEKISLEILKGSKSLDVFPTPIDRIVAYAELIVRNDIDVSKIHTGYLVKANNALRRALAKVRGLLDRKEKTIYLDLAQGFNRKNFVKLHEVGHEVLTWQKCIYDVLDDDDQSLSSDCIEEFEIEANCFASLTLFQHDRFMNELSKLNLSIESSMQLAKHFGSSIHAALRRYAECSKNRCGLIVLEKRAIGTSQCFLKNFIQSASFIATFGQLELPATLDCTWPFVRDYYNGRKLIKNGMVSISTKNGKVDFAYHYFNNNYNALVFVFPYGEKKSSRTTIILKESY